MKKIIIAIVASLLFCCMSAQNQTISINEFEKRLIENNGEQLIDIRTPQEFEKYHIPGAKNIDFRNPDFAQRIDSLDKTKPVFIYCLSGRRTVASFPIFETAGFKTVYDLEGGINAWSKADKPLQQDTSGKGEFTVTDYDAAISAQGYVLVDFYAPWCAPCRNMLPMVSELEKTYAGQFKLLTIDFDQSRLLVQEKGIKSVPYLMVFKDGVIIWTKAGETSKSELIKVLNLH